MYIVGISKIHRRSEVWYFVNMNSELHKFRILNKLKSVYRFAKVGNRNESSAEHSWGALMLADFYLTKMEQNGSSVKLDRLRVYELIMYHDVVEIEAGDTPMGPNIDRAGKNKLENDAADLLTKKLPNIIADKYLKLFFEFQNQKTVEARFAKAIEAMEADIHELDYKEDWKGWTEEFLKHEKEHLFGEFPELKKSFEELVIYLKDNGYFDVA